jgi:hypothetical protein
LDGEVDESWMQHDWQRPTLFHWIPERLCFSPVLQVTNLHVPRIPAISQFFHKESIKLNFQFPNSRSDPLLMTTLRTFERFCTPNSLLAKI